MKKEFLRNKNTFFNEKEFFFKKKTLNIVALRKILVTF